MTPFSFWSQLLFPKKKKRLGGGGGGGRGEVANVRSET